MVIIFVRIAQNITAIATTAMSMFMKIIYIALYRVMAVKPFGVKDAANRQPMFVMIAVNTHHIITEIQVHAYAKDAVITGAVVMSAGSFSPMMICTIVKKMITGIANLVIVTAPLFMITVMSLN